MLRVVRFACTVCQTRKSVRSTDCRRNPHRGGGALLCPQKRCKMYHSFPRKILRKCANQQGFFKCSYIFSYSYTPELSLYIAHNRLQAKTTPACSTQRHLLYLHSGSSSYTKHTGSQRLSSRARHKGTRQARHQPTVGGRAVTRPHQVRDRVKTAVCYMARPH